MEKVVDVAIARRQFGTLLDEVFHRGDTFTIKRQGKALAQIVPIKGYSCEEVVSSQQEALLSELNSLPDIRTSEEPTEILKNIREQKRTNAKNRYDK